MDRRILCAALGCFALALLLYTCTLAPTFGWGDSADLATRMAMDADKTFVGSGRDYPLYRWIGGFFQLLPFGDVGTRANAMAAFFGAMTVGLVAFISGIVARSMWAAWATGIALAVSHTFWLMSVIAEVYSFNAALIFAAYALMAIWWRGHDKRYAIAAAFFVGLSLNHHASGLLVAASVAPLFLLRIRQCSLEFIVWALLAFVAASYPYWLRVYLQLNAGYPWMKVVGILAPTNVNYTILPLHEVIKFMAYTAYNFIGVALPLAVLGIMLAWRRRMIEMVPPMLWLVVMAGAGIISSIPDKFNIYVLVYPVVAIAVGMGVVQVRDRFAITNWSMLLLLISLAVVPPLGYVMAVHVTRQLNIDLVGARVLPYRDNDWYFMVPWKRGDFGPRRYAEEALAAVEKNAVLIADYSLWRPLYFMQTMEGMRNDVRLVWVEPLMWGGTVAQYIAKQPCHRPVYLATDTPPNYYQLTDIRAQYAVIKMGAVLRIERSCCP